jgi:hypothetical protein
MPVTGGGFPLATITVYVQSYLNSATTVELSISNALTGADLKNAMNTAEGVPIAIMNMYFADELILDTDVLSEIGIADQSYIQTSNNLTEPGLWTKEERQNYKLELASLKREIDSRRYTLDLTQLPNPYNDNVVDPDENANTGGLVEGRPWV